jgi:hypothetical protein
MELTTGLAAFDELMGPLLPGSIYLLAGRTQLTSEVLDRFLVRAAMANLRSYLIDGGHGADPFAMARVLRRWRVDPRRPLEMVMVARAFTAYQMDSLILQGLPALGEPPGLLVVSSMDALLSDPEVDRDEAMGMLSNWLEALDRTAARGSCVILAAHGGGREGEVLTRMGEHCSSWASFRERGRGRTRIVVKGGLWTEVVPLHPLQMLMEDFTGQGAASEAV